MNSARTAKKPEENEKYGTLKTCYSVAILRARWWSKAGKKRAEKQTDFRRGGLGYKLNFCPECGKKITRRNLKNMHDIKTV